MRAVDAGDRSGFSFFLCVSSLNPAISDPTSAINFLPMSQMRWWLLQLITTWLTETKSLPLMPEMHVSSVWMPLVTASGGSLLLDSLWTQSVSLNKNSALCEVQKSRGSIRQFLRLLWQSCHYKRGIKHHRTPSAQLTSTLEQQSILYQLLNTAQERNDKWKWYCVYGWPRSFCDFQLQRWCGLASVGWEGRPEQL